MSGSYYGKKEERERRRRLYLIFLLVPLAFLLGGASVAILDHRSAAPTASLVAAASPSPTDTSVTTTAPTDTPMPTPTPTASEVVAAATGTMQASPTPAPSLWIIVSGANFGISGSVSGLLPGVTRPIKLVITNPNGVAIYITKLTVTLPANSTPPGCTSADNLALVQSDASTANPIMVPASGSVTLSAAPRAPQVTLLNLPSVNQDACKGKKFALTFSGSAHS